jgi:hypothetical protein
VAVVNFQTIPSGPVDEAAVPDEDYFPAAGDRLEFDYGTTEEHWIEGAFLRREDDVEDGIVSQLCYVESDDGQENQIFLREIPWNPLFMCDAKCGCFTVGDTRCEKCNAIREPQEKDDDY